MVAELNRFLAELDKRTFYKYVAGLLAAMILIMGIIFYVHHRKILNLRTQIKKLNTQRDEVQRLLSTFECVKQQKSEVEALLEKDKNFKIVGYVDDLLTSLGLAGNKAGLQQSEESLENIGAYTEIKVVVTLSDISTRQLAELLQQIEKNERVHMNTLTITKSPTKASIDASFTLGTVQSRATEEALS